MSAQHLRAQKMSGIGENLSDVRASSAVLSRSTSAVQNDARSSSAGLASFGGMHKAQAVQDLFGAAGSEKHQQLMTIFLQSSNASACREITAFAKVYSQLIHQPDLSEEARTTLNTLAQQYTDEILNDGLGEKSAFGPWTVKTDKPYQKRSKLEHTLAMFANTHSAGDFLQLGHGFMAREVMPFIQTCLEQKLGAALNEATSQRLHELVDKAAMQTFAALRQSSVGLVEQRGVGVGKLARDLDTVATLPRLLRDILANQPKDLSQTTQPTPAPGSSEVPDAVDPDLGPGPALGRGQGQGGITINIGDIHIDKSQHIDNTRHAGARGERPTPTPLAQNLNLRVNLKVNSDTTSEATSRSGGDKPYAGESLSSRYRVQEAHVQTVESLKADGGYVSQETSSASIPAGELKTLRPMQHAETQTSNSSANGLFNAARGVANSLSQLLDRVDTRAAYQSDVTLSQRNALTAMPAQERHENELKTAAAEPLTIPTDAQATSRLTAFPSGPTLQQAVKTELQSAVKPDTSETEKPTVVSSHAKLKFREGNLYTLPTLAYLRSTGGQAKPEHELLKAVRSMLEADSNQPFAIRRDFDGLRNRLLPGYDADRTQLLRQFRNGSIDGTLKNDVDTLRDLLAEHPGLDRRRPAVANFARTLIRECGLIKPGQQPNPLVVALLDGVAGTGDNKWDWRDEAQRKLPQSAASGVVLTTDGLHLDPLHMRKNHHAK